MTAPWTRSSIVVAPSRGAFRRTTKGWSAGPSVRSRQGRADPQRLLRGLGGRALCLDLLRRHVAAIGVAARDHLVRDLGVAGGAGELEDSVAVPVEAEPAHPVEDRVNRGLGGADAVGVFDPQQEAAAMVAGEEPVEQGRARAAQMQEAGRRGREAGHDPHGLRTRVVVGCAHARMLPSCDGWRVPPFRPLA
jgi:hypothetical protein